MTKTDFTRFVKFLEAAEKEGFYGEISFKFKDGTIYTVSKNATLKPDDI